MDYGDIRKFQGGIGQGAPVMGFGVPSDQLRATQPQPPGSLSQALMRLNEAIEDNGRLAESVGERLEGTGVLRPATPETDSSGAQQPMAQSQLASAITAMAWRAETVNGRLSGMYNRIEVL